MSIFAWLGALAVGLALGLTGAGGSIITMPVLVYLAAVPPQTAVGMSLLVVGVAALAGAVQRALAGEVHGRAVVLFSLSGMLGATLGARMTHQVSGELLLLLFAALMLTVAVKMLTARSPTNEPAADCRPVRCLMAGFGVGAMTGFLGVGGGFLLVPALVRFARLPLRMAAGSSLAIIAINSATGFFSHWGESEIRWPLAGIFAALAVFGTVAGNALATRLPVQRLQQFFAVLVLLTGGYVLWKNMHAVL